MEKNQIIEINIEDMLDDGRAFGRYEGCAVFVTGGTDAVGNHTHESSSSSKDGSDKRDTSVRLSSVRAVGAVPGDKIRARITKAKRTSAEASLIEIVEASPDRIPAECPYYGRCGGCSMQEMSYDAQKRLKTEQVRSKLKRLGGLEDPRVNDIVGADTLKYYRNKAVFAVGPHGEVGFVRGKSHFVIDVEDCMLQNDPAMVCADALRHFLKETGTKCITQLVVRTAFGTGEVMAVLESTQRDIPDIELLAEMLNDAIYSLSPAADEESGVALSSEESDDVKSDDQLEPDLIYSLESIAVIHKGKCRIVAGKPTITEEVILDDGRSILYEISPQSFYQVNPEQMVKLYDKAAEYAGLECMTQDDNRRDKITVLDLYCGAGTIGIWLLDRLRSIDADAFAKARVIGIESVKPAVIDANRNSVINDLTNTRYICGKAEEELPGMMGLASLYKWNEVNERVKREPEISIGRGEDAITDARSGQIAREHISKVDVIILDPPRAGCDEALLSAAVSASPGRIVYVSCDPATLARDIRYLTEHGYEFIECTPYDQFPWTSHIENCCLLKKRCSN